MKFRRVRGVPAAIFFSSVMAVVIQSRDATGIQPLSGKDLFERRCSGCHATDASKEGPRLRGVVGRKAGSLANFPYSDALRNSGITWTEGQLMKWLENPEALVKDNDMEFRVANADERVALIAYLKSLTN